MIDDWLSYQVRIPNGYVRFQVIDIREKKQPDAPISEYLGREIIGSYRNLEFLKSAYRTEPESALVQYIKDYVISSEKNTIAKNVWQGDFGEILAGLIVSHFEGLKVPLKKLRLKFNRERSVFCTDMVAHDEPISTLHYYEIKTRLKVKRETVNGLTANITVIAHNSLHKDEQAPNEFIADFLSRMHYDNQQWEEARRYSDIVKNPRSYAKNYELFFIIDDKSTIVEILDDLEALPPALQPLRTTVVLIKDLGRLIVTMKQVAIEEAKKYVYHP
jgi:hypothetical protein